MFHLIRLTFIGVKIYSLNKTYDYNMLSWTPQGIIYCTFQASHLTPLIQNSLRFCKHERMYYTSHLSSFLIEYQTYANLQHSK